jgi:hypothetical protein
VKIDGNVGDAWLVGSMTTRAASRMPCAIPLAVRRRPDYLRAMTALVRILSLAMLVVGLLVVPARADDLADARAFITKQVDQLKKADVEGLKAGFTKRLQEKITEANVKKGQKEVGSMTIDDLVASVTPSKDSLKIKMKNGRTLTTLVKVDGKWLADTVWFK